MQKVSSDKRRASGGVDPTPVAQPEANPCPPHSLCGQAWHDWFERVGEHATIDVVNATANLVITERDIHASTTTPTTTAVEAAKEQFCVICKHSSLTYDYFLRRCNKIISGISICGCNCGWPNGSVSAPARRTIEALISEFDDYLVRDFRPTLTGTDREVLTTIIAKYLPAQQPKVEPHGDMTLEEEIAWRRERDVSILASMKAQGEWIERLKGEVKRLQLSLAEWESHRDGIIEAVQTAENAVVTARADAINECIDRVQGERLHENLDNESDRGYQNALGHIVGALEELKVSNP